jgi:hypothetical protein
VQLHLIKPIIAMDIIVLAVVNEAYIWTQPVMVALMRACSTPGRVCDQGLPERPWAAMPQRGVRARGTSGVRQHGLLGEWPSACRW